MFESKELFYAILVLLCIYLLHLVLVKQSSKTEQFGSYNVNVDSYTLEELDEIIDQFNEYIEENGIPADNTKDVEAKLVRDLLTAIDSNYVDKDAPFTTNDTSKRELWANFRCEHLELCDNEEEDEEDEEEEEDEEDEEDED